MATSTPRTELSGLIVKTSYLLSNFHCSSCASVIQETLSRLHPRPFSIAPSLVSSLVTVRHHKLLPARDIQEALENAGFDVVASNDTLGKTPKGPNEESLYLDRFLGRWDSNDPVATRRSKHFATHVQNCAFCQLSVFNKNGPRTDSDAKLKPQGKRKDSMPTLLNDTIIPLVAIESGAHDVWRASLAIGGMTCASCSASISQELLKIEWVRDVTVNLLSNTAMVEFIGKEHADMIVQHIEDIGFEAGIDTVVSLKNEAPVNSSRTVELLIDGMFCAHCPPRVLGALKKFGDQLMVDHKPTIKDPILKITYTPEAPGFTIRNIIFAISSLSSITASVYHPPTLEERSRKIHRRERLRLFSRVVVTITVAIPTFIIGIVYMSLVSSNNPGRSFLMQPWHYGLSRTQWSLFILSTPVYFLCADVFHIRALKEIRAMWRPGSTVPFLRRFYRFGSMNMLMSLGTSIAYWSSLAELIETGVMRPMMVDHDAFYFDSVVFLTMFLLIGRLIEAYSKSKAGDAVLLLGKLRPTEAILLEAGIETQTDNQYSSISNPEPTRKIGVDLLEFGDTVKVLYGASPPCDGMIVDGSTNFDESSLTGESKLIQKSVGDMVYSGTINKNFPVSIKITGVAGSSMLDQIVKAVREGQTRRAPIERIADILTSYFVPFVTLTAISTWIIWLALGYSGTLPLEYLGDSSGSWGKWSLQFAIAVFVVACPCGLGLAAPTALFVGGGLAAQNGILAKGGGEAFEKASRLDCIVFDKTGTLTHGGEPVVTDYMLDIEIETRDLSSGSKAIAEGEMLAMINSIEHNSSHPIAKAITSLCRVKKVRDIEGPGMLEEVAGQGMRGRFVIDGQILDVIVGNEYMMLENKTPISDVAKGLLYSWKSSGKSVALAAINRASDSNGWYLAAMFAISDPIRPEAPAVIRALRDLGTDVWMLSGDNQITANAIGLQVGILPDNIIAGVLPSQKAEKIQYLQQTLKSHTAGSEHNTKRALVAMVGDGINDSPALTTADVGIAIGSGSDIAISSAEFVLVSSNLEALLTLLDLSKVVFRRIKFNFAWAIVYNIIALPVAAGVLYPVVSHGKHVRLDPVWASLAMALSSISVVCSSLLMRWRVPVVGWRKKALIKKH